MSAKRLEPRENHVFEHSARIMQLRAVVVGVGLSSGGLTQIPPTVSSPPHLRTAVECQAGSPPRTARRLPGGHSGARSGPPRPSTAILSATRHPSAIMAEPQPRGPQTPSPRTHRRLTLDAPGIARPCALASVGGANGPHPPRSSDPNRPGSGANIIPKPSNVSANLPKRYRTSPLRTS